MKEALLSLSRTPSYDDSAESLRSRLADVHGRMDGNIIAASLLLDYQQKLEQQATGIKDQLKQREDEEWDARMDVVPDSPIDFEDVVRKDRSTRGPSHQRKRSRSLVSSPSPSKVTGSRQLRSTRSTASVAEASTSARTLDDSPVKPPAKKSRKAHDVEVTSQTVEKGSKVKKQKAKTVATPPV